MGDKLTAPTTATTPVEQRDLQTVGPEISFPGAERSAGSGRCFAANPTTPATKRSLVGVVTLGKTQCRVRSKQN